MHVASVRDAKQSHLKFYYPSDEIKLTFWNFVNLPKIPRIEFTSCQINAPTYRKMDGILDLYFFIWKLFVIITKTIHVVKKL